LQPKFPFFGDPANAATVIYGNAADLFVNSADPLGDSADLNGKSASRDPMAHS